MNEDVEYSLGEFFSLVFDMIPPWVLSLFVLSFSLFSIFHLFSLLLGERTFLFSGFGSWFKRWITDFMCKTSWGFQLMYKIGWALPGVHFFDCGIHCDVCPKSSECSNSLPDVSHS